MSTITFDGRVAIVTGAGGGLGRAHAFELARRGAAVVVNDLGGDPDGTGGGKDLTNETVTLIEEAGGLAIANYDSVATPEGGASIARAAIDKFGRIDILVNNAGILRDRAFGNVDFADLEAILDVHLRGAFHVTKPAFQVMKEQSYGRIVFTSSAAGIFGNFGQSTYGAAKMGLVGLSNVLAVEGGRYGITSNVISPIAKTRLTVDFLGDMADRLAPELVTPLVLYLVSEASQISHEIFSVGGGRYARAFIGLCPGWDAPPGTAGPTVEDIREHLPQIRDETGYVVPSGVVEEMRIVAERLAATQPGERSSAPDRALG